MRSITKGELPLLEWKYNPEIKNEIIHEVYYIFG